ncbi:uncharacterized protein LOC131672475 isoform X2 [Phymastichus coffea]|uniref:uncharacterized protein LOC131672475 isoform X2 n=1 Tax=Phymastichus coffea TaxID=108790 RepID=UPI00273B66EA|nr:uncharacterized protein LOC131672475 isoform X2 [Phymastichus coffea]
MVGHELISIATMHKTTKCKLNLQGKLSLKRSSSDSVQGISNSDSLADFKLPKQELVQEPILNRYKLDARKATTKIAISKTKSAVKSRKSDVNQPSIKATLLKSQTSNQNQTDLKEAIPCPVCLKLFKDDTACTSHMKSCAAKNNVSIKQLLEAKRLQDRQAQERKAIGLIAAPILPEKKKAFQSKNFSTKDDPQLQLGLAMSESLHEAEKMIKLKEAAFLAGIPMEYVTEMNDEERKKTLQSFGFTTNKSIADISTIKQRKKKLLAPTVLQTRSKEDKDRVLTERIACILTDEDALTQARENTAISYKHETLTSITSKLLKKIEQTDNKLWDQSKLTKRFNKFYIEEIKSHFFKFKRQSVESENYQSLTEECEKENTSVVYESPMDCDIIINNQNVERNNSKCEIFNMNELKRNDFELEFVQSVIDNWKEALNDSSVSDVIIFVENNKHIYAHKLVFHIQCPNILLDIQPLDAVFNSSVKEKIAWLDKEQSSALAFLEFIYSGTISKYINIFYQEKLVHQVEQLARLYKKQNLFTYIRKKQQEFRNQRKHSEMLKDFNNVQGKKNTNCNKSMHNKLSQKYDDLRNSKSIFSENPLINIYCSADKLVAKNIIPNNLTDQLIERGCAASPDLFESEEDENNSSRITTIYDSDSENVQSTNKNIKEDDEQDSDESEHLNSQKTLVNLSRSVSPLENIHEAITPPSGQSPKIDSDPLKYQIFNEGEITEVPTPKCQSPEKVVDIKQEIIQSEDLAAVVTPEYVALTELSTPKKLVYTNIALNDIMAQGNNNESIYTAVTPPRLQEESDKMIDRNMHKIKSELTIFIEKVQRRNAKDIMDTDSETDSPDIRIKHKNPFLKKDQDDSYEYLQNNKNKQYQKAISLIEKDLLHEQKLQQNLENIEIHESIEDNLENLRNDNSVKSKFQQVSSSNSLICPSANTKENISLLNDEVEDITATEFEESMYTKYKKSNRYDNSIAFYRKKLCFNEQQIYTDKKAWSKSIVKNDLKYLETSRSTVSQSTTVKKPKPRIIEDITLVSDSDEEKSPLRTFLRDKNKKKSSRNSPVTDISSNKDLQIDTVTTALNTENNNTFPLEFVNESLDPSKNSKVFNSTVLKDESKNKVIDLSMDSDEDNLHVNSTIQNNELLVQSDKSTNKSKSFFTELQTRIDKRRELEEAERKSEDIDAKISEILQPSQQITNVDVSSNSDQGNLNVEEEFGKDNNVDIIAFSSEREIVDLSLISIVSSPDDLHELAKINSQRLKNNYINNNKCNIYSQNSESSQALKENDNFDSLAYSDQYMKTKESVRNIKFLEKSSRDTVTLNGVESDCFNGCSRVTDNKTSSLITSPILSQNRRSSGEAEVESSKIIVKSKNNSGDTRKLRVRSASASTLTGKMEKTSRLGLKRCSSFVSPKQNKKSSNNREFITSPLDYSLSYIDTPNLQKELKKFGLKPQSRTKATALLTHIYKEIHSQPLAPQKRTSNMDSLSEEYEPPAKRRQCDKRATKNIDTTNEHYSKTGKRSDDCTIIAEEMDFDDPDVASIFENPVSIKDAFFKLIKTNRELYNQVLTYEPLTLETLHSMLKQNGFKCQFNNLMDFLDEQCITFQVKANKSNYIKK